MNTKPLSTPRNKMSTEQTYIKTHKFRPHSGGNYGLFGINMFGCDSTIRYTENDGSIDIWRFLYFTAGSNDAIYINGSGVRRKFNLNDQNIASRVLRLEEDI